MKRYLHKNRHVEMDDNFWDNLVSPKCVKKKLNLSKPISGTWPKAKKALSRFTSKEARFVNGQLDTTNLKAVLRNCKVYDGWINSEFRDENRLGKFSAVAKLRNDHFAHNNTHRLSLGV